MADDPLDVEWDEADPHPGIQCHEAHPDRPHRRPRVPNPRPSPLFRETMIAPVTITPVEPPAAGGTVDQATALVLLGSDPWSRFDTWSQRAWELAEKSLKAAEAEGARNATLTMGSEVIYDPRAQNLLDAARMCAEIAQTVCPLAAIGGLPPRLSELELELPPEFRG